MSKVSLRHTRDVDTPMLARRWTTSTPRWVKVFVIIFIVLVLLFVMLHLTGNGFGDHLHMAATHSAMQSATPLEVQPR